MMLFKRSFGLTRSLFILYIHEHDPLGFGMLTVETAVLLVPIVFVLIVPIATEKVSRITIRSNIIWNRWKSILRARSICTLLIRPGEILESVARPYVAGLR